MAKKVQDAEDIKIPIKTFESENENTNIKISVPSPNQLSQIQSTEGSSVLGSKRLEQKANLVKSKGNINTHGTIELEDVFGVGTKMREVLYTIGVRSPEDLYQLYTERDNTRKNNNLSYIIGLYPLSKRTKESYIDTIADVIYTHPKRNALLTKQDIINELSKASSKDFIQERTNDYKAYLQYLGVGTNKESVVAIQSPGAEYTIDLAKEIYKKVSGKDVYIEGQSRKTYNKSDPIDRRNFLKFKVKDIISRSGVENPLGNNVNWSFTNLPQVLGEFMGNKSIMEFFEKDKTNPPQDADYNELGNAIMELLTAGEIQTDNVYGLKLNDKNMAENILSGNAVRIGMTNNPNLKDVSEKQVFEYLKSNTKDVPHNTLKVNARTLAEEGKRPKGFKGFIISPGNNQNDNIRLTATAISKKEEDLDHILEGLSIDPITGFVPSGFDNTKKLDIPQYNVLVYPAISDVNKFLGIKKVEEEADKWIITIDGNADPSSKSTLWEGKNPSAKDSVKLLEKTETNDDAINYMASNFTYGGSACNRVGYNLDKESDTEKRMGTVLDAVNKYLIKYGYGGSLNDIQLIANNINTKQRTLPIEQYAFNRQTKPTCEHITYKEESGNIKMIIPKNNTDFIGSGKSKKDVPINSPLALKLNTIKSKCKNDMECVAGKMIISQNITDDYLKSSGGTGIMTSPVDVKLISITNKFPNEKEDRKKAIDDLVELTLSTVSGIPMTEEYTTSDNKVKQRNLSSEKKLKILENAKPFKKIKLTLQPLNFDTMLHNDSVYK